MSPADGQLQGVLLEPLHRQLARWEVVVVPSPEDGPVALLPAEVEQYSVLQELADADLALTEWRMMQVRRNKDAATSGGCMHAQRASGCDKVGAAAAAAGCH